MKHHFLRAPEMTTCNINSSVTQPPRVVMVFHRLIVMHWVYIFAINSYDIIYLVKQVIFRCGSWTKSVLSVLVLCLRSIDNIVYTKPHKTSWISQQSIKCCIVLWILLNITKIIIRITWKSHIPMMGSLNIWFQGEKRKINVSKCFSANCSHISGWRR